MIFKCPKCRNPIIDGETVVLHFKIDDKHIYFCEICGRKFKELKNVIDDKYNEQLAEAFGMFIHDLED